MIQTERCYDIVFDKPSGNPVIIMIKSKSGNYEGDERTYIDKDGDEIVRAYRCLILAQSSSGYDSWVVLKSLDKETKF